MDARKKVSMEVIKRVIHALNFDNPKQLSDSLGFDRPERIYKVVRGETGISRNLAETISKKYPQFSKDYLLTGKDGDDSENVQVLHESKATEYKKDQEIPLFDIEATAGVVGLLKNPGSQKIIDTIKIPNMPKSDGGIIVTGDSMYPIIKSGDIVIFKIISDIPQSIFFGNAYIVSIDVEGDEMTVVKYVKKGKDADHVLLVSHNTHHADKEINIKNINGMALVKASIRFNSLT